MPRTSPVSASARSTPCCLSLRTLPTASEPGTGIRAGVTAYANALDELVLRAMTPGDDVRDYLDFVQRAADALGLARR